MHGRKRQDNVVVPEEVRAKLLAKISKYAALSDKSLSRLGRGQFNFNSYRLVGKLISMNPDFYTLWNFRRIIIARLLTAWTTQPSPDTTEAPSTTDEDGGTQSTAVQFAEQFGPLWADTPPSKLVSAELELVVSALERNPKCYSAWAHRRWVIAVMVGCGGPQRTPSSAGDTEPGGDSDINTDKHAVCGVFGLVRGSGSGCMVRRYMGNNVVFANTDVDGGGVQPDKDGTDEQSCPVCSQTAHRLPAHYLHDELKLCDRFLEMDARNFHCWNYRRWVVERLVLLQGSSLMGDRHDEKTGSGDERDSTSPTAKGISPLYEQEVGYTETLITKNFSNYSAWHHRSAMLGRVLRSLAAEQKDQHRTEQNSSDNEDGSNCADATHLAESLLADELKLVRNAAFTEAADQSVWLYYRWLAAQIVGPAVLSRDRPVFGVPLPCCAVPLVRESWCAQTMAEELKHMRDLYELEGKCRFVGLMLGVLLVIHARIQQDQTPSKPEKDQGPAEDAKQEDGTNGESTLKSTSVEAQLQLIHQRLVEIDPLRTRFYGIWKAALCEQVAESS